MLYIPAVIICLALLTIIFYIYKQKNTTRAALSKNIIGPIKLYGTFTDIPSKAKLTYTPPTQIESNNTNKYGAINANSDTWAQRTVLAAIESAKQGNGPFAATLLQIDNETNNIIRYWTSHNEVVKSNDPTAHAEVQVIRKACESLGNFSLDNITNENSKLDQPGLSSHTVLYSSCEPCPMCMAACYWAKISRVIFCSTGTDALNHANFADDAIFKELKLPYEYRKHMEVQYAPCEHNTKAFDIYNDINNSINIYGRSFN